MVKLTYKNRKILQDKLEREAEDFDYRFIRYEVNYCLVIIYTPEPIDLFPLLSKYIRETDHAIMLQDQLYAVIFDSADETKGIKAANKLLTLFQHLYFSHSIFASITTASDYNSPAQMISKLFDLLDYSISHNIDHHVVDASQVMKSR